MVFMIDQGELAIFLSCSASSKQASGMHKDPQISKAYMDCEMNLLRDTVKHEDNLNYQLPWSCPDDRYDCRTIKVHLDPFTVNMRVPTQLSYVPCHMLQHNVVCTNCCL